MGSQPLLERHAELEQLSTWARGTRTDGSLVLVSGPAGIGKTSLVEAFLASRPASRVLRGACESLSTPQPLAPLADLARGDDHLSDLLASGAAPIAVYGAVRDGLAARRGTTLLLEDLHWADDATLDLLRYLARRLTSVPALVIATYRDDEIGAGHPLRVLLGDIGAHSSIRRTTLRPLSEQAVAALAAPTGVDGVGLWHRTGGNPFFVTEVLAANGATLPPTVSDAVLARAARLPEGARALLATVAVLGRDAELPILRSVAPSLVHHVDRCVDAGMLGADRNAVGFRHELARLAVAAATPPGRRAELHRSVLAALEAAGAPAATLAHHAEEAGDRAATRRHADDAAQHATRLGAHRQAAEQWQRVLRALPATADAERADVLGRCSYACALSDHIAEATEEAEQALRLWRALDEPLREGDTLSWLARLAWMSQRVDDADRLGRTAAALLEQLPAGVELARARATVAQHLATHLGPAEARDWGRRARELAEQLGADAIAAQATIDLGLSRALTGDLGGLGEMRTGVAAAIVARSDDHAARGLFQMVRVACVALDHEAVDERAAAAQAFCAERGVEFWGDYARAFRAQNLLHRGQFDDAVTEAGPVWHRTAPTSPAVRTATVAVNLGLVRLRRGEADPDDLLDVAARTAVLPSLKGSLGVAAARAEAAWLAGGGQAVLDEVRSAWHAARSVTDGWWNAELAWWLDVLGAPEEVEGRGGFAGGVAGGWQPAADGFGALGLPYHRAMALAGSHEEAPLREALAIAHALGVHPLSRLVSRRLRALGARRIPQPPGTDRWRDGTLTAREREVLDLLAEGLRDAEIAAHLHLSARTVNHHVSAILRKLDVSTRAAAAARAHRESTK
ncbi:LuxR family transcriptional regulator [Actinomycetospora sp. NBRC 106375]|uniref:ATP-binding protein n=1 Tax=Actinomycetospora sp. NBRC 106375 TaxID=3032207 RepID=UPI0024A2BB91|nr:LuxR family transcriptional regulator [Actinomycetospora sp. NBRC 106375]GLZ45037.1 LuxR family transcriptional regulator [Actinomycetospora sp. NBRC 106375]